MRKTWRLALVLGAAMIGIASAQDAPPVKVEMRMISDQGVGDSAGTVTITPAQAGLVFTIDVAGMPEGEHGFHLHQNASCEPAEKDGKMTAGEAAGGHFDPASTDAHEGPEGDGHLGDLPKLNVPSGGKLQTEITASRLKLEDLRGHALMIHSGGDTYSEPPESGGGGARIMCGIIQ